MSNSLRRRLLAVTSAAILTVWGSAAVASADTSAGHGNSGAHGTSTASSQSKIHPKKVAGRGHSGPHGTSSAPGLNKSQTNKGNANSGAHGSANAPGQTTSGTPEGTGHGDPAGNNGTIKITPLGERDGTPNNNPHVTCGFQIEWYGFDQGDYYSQVSFAMQAPTKDATITPNGPTSVFVGADPASGAGTATGLDARASYYPTFTGTPHPPQGFHVKVTVATPFSKGNNTKSKVFWVQPCTAGVPGGVTPPAGPGGGTSGGGAVAGPGGGTGLVDVTGLPASPAAVPGAGVPTAVDAGQGDASVLGRVRSPLPLLAMAAVLGVVALWSRRRTHADG